MNKLKYLFILLALLSAAFYLHSCKNKTMRVEGMNVSKPVDFAVTLDGDTVWTQTFNLKNGYTLTFFITQTEGQMCISGGQTYPCRGDQHARLTGNGIDTVVMSIGIMQSKYLLRFDNIDFDNYFVLENSGGGNFSLYTNVFEKCTGNLVLEGRAGTYDTTNDLIIFQDDENNDAVMLYDLKRNKKTEITENYNDSGFSNMGAITAYKIDKVTSKTVYVGFYGGLKKDKYIFKIPRNEMVNIN